VRRGFGVIAIDVPYFGERDTGLLRAFSEADKHEQLYNRESTYLQWVVQLAKDVGRTIDLLVDRYAVDPDRIAYVGFSRGAQAGFVVVGAEPRLRAAAMLYGGHFDRSETGHLAAACPANYIGRIAPRPLWLLNGTFDGDYDRAKSVEPLYRHAGEPKEVVWVETGHQLPRDQDLERMADWLGSVLD
jgi:predicted esterase